MGQQNIRYNSSLLDTVIDGNELEQYNDAVAASETMLQKKNGPGADFLGWLNLPAEIDQPTISRINETAAAVRNKADILICIGIGGSYLGAKAVIEFLSPSFDALRKPQVVFAGHAINSDYLADLLDLVEDRSVAVNVISKSGTTTEPGIAFRTVREWMEKKYGRKEAASRIIATTDPEKGALRQLAQAEGYTTFPIPADVGGRFSVLTPVGLFPVAVAGIPIEELVAGAVDAMSFCNGTTVETNLSGKYAAIRNILFRRGYTTEMLANFQPHLHFVGEWWKQLAGESEGKNNTGIFPAAVDYTTDLHSLGQWMQEGIRNVFETFMVLESTSRTLSVPEFEDDSDGLNYLAGKSYETINSSAFKGTLLAHIDGGVPCATLSIEDRTPRSLGQLFYFFEKAIALSGYMLRVNPFDQPGVEAYKKNMFALLGKKGFEELGSDLQARTKKLGV
ncbi:MAG: glucose-6-phosphate isomerase [Chitinispirillaceae bacterium]|nr:glucose-6-phosphate isomerase [Chitinispirillaceae bacterium]